PLPALPCFPTRRSSDLNAALVGQQLAHRADASAAQMVDVVQRTLAFLQAEQVLGGGYQIGFGEDARVAAFDSKLLIDLVATDPRSEEHTSELQSRSDIV